MPMPALVSSMPMPSYGRRTSVFAVDIRNLSVFSWSSLTMHRHELIAFKILILKKIAEVGTLNFFLSPQPQFRNLKEALPQSQFRNFLRNVAPQLFKKCCSAIPQSQFFFFKSATLNPQLESFTSRSFGIFLAMESGLFMNKKIIGKKSHATVPFRQILFSPQLHNQFRCSQYCGVVDLDCGCPPLENRRSKMTLRSGELVLVQGVLDGVTWWHGTSLCYCTILYGSCWSMGHVGTGSVGRGHLMT